ncbi:hypothetical protein SBRCBS47491_000871 [Sporothrix bragantina]|uniref:Uncharacterized protein n=1 Tax=Sporothrix bragantina TaxID=671064 RepID=A0ABP0ATX6_9PEZI
MADNGNTLKAFMIECAEIMIRDKVNQILAEHEAARQNDAGSKPSLFNLWIDGFLFHLVNTRPIWLISLLLWLKAIVHGLLEMFVYLMVRVRTAEGERQATQEEAREERAFQRQKNLYMLNLAVARAQAAVYIPLKDRSRPEQQEEEDKQYFEAAEANFERLYREPVFFNRRQGAAAEPQNEAGPQDG